MALHADASKQRRWLDLIQRWQKSRLSVREFCRRSAVSEPSFYLWRRVLRVRGLIQDAPSSQSASSPLPAFVKLTVAREDADPSAVEVVLGAQRVLRVRPGFDPQSLLQLVRLLEEEPPC